MSGGLSNIDHGNPFSRLTISDQAKQELDSDKNLVRYKLNVGGKDRYVYLGKSLYKEFGAETIRDVIEQQLKNYEGSGLVNLPVKAFTEDFKQKFRENISPRIDNTELLDSTISTLEGMKRDEPEKTYLQHAQALIRGIIMGK